MVILCTDGVGGMVDVPTTLAVERLFSEQLLERLPRHVDRDSPFCRQGRLHPLAGDSVIAPITVAVV
eukprot:9646958-Heterocapsa_arctica.AAC.1